MLREVLISLENLIYYTQTFRTHFQQQVPIWLILYKPRPRQGAGRAGQSAAVCTWPTSLRVSAELVMLLEWWSCTECTLFTDQATVDSFGKEHVVIILNHNFEIDFLCGWTMCERFGVLGVSNVGVPGGCGVSDMGSQGEAGMAPWRVWGLQGSECSFALCLSLGPSELGV